MIICIANLAFVVHTQIFVNRHQYRMEVFNDSIVYVGSIHAMALVTTIGDVEKQDTIGWSLMLFVVGALGLNLFLIYGEVVNRCRKNLKVKMIRFNWNSQVWDFEYANSKHCNCQCEDCGIKLTKTTKMTYLKNK